MDINDTIDIDRQIKLLLVEDDTNSANALKLMLDKRGVPTTVTANAQDALQQFKNNNFDIIVSDIRLKGMSGVDLLRHVRKEHREFPVILLTGYDSLESAIQAIRLGAQNYILKPLKVIEDLLAPVEKAVKTHRLAQRNKILETKLKESEITEKQLGTIKEFASGVAHDLNNIMVSCVGLPDLTLTSLKQLNTTDDINDICENIEAIQCAALTARDIIVDLQTLSRKPRDGASPLNLNEVVEDYWQSSHYVNLKTTAYNIKIEKELDEDLQQVNGVLSLLYRIVMNLVVNACDAMPEGGRIVIKTYNKCVQKDIAAYQLIREGDYAVLSVSDSGTGISKKNLEHIFDPFYTKKKLSRTSGTGLGLTIVRGILQEHMGYIDIKSEPEKGTEFILYFPVAKTDNEKQADKLAPMRGAETILVVDDIAEQADITKQFLKKLGYNVVTASSGRKAIELYNSRAQNSKVHPARKRYFDLLLLDMRLEEDFDGLDTYREILNYHPFQKCIIVSGFPATKRIKETMSLGATRFLSKPFTMQKLSRAVRLELDHVL
ncbi:response regulator [Verrucomicrobiota bacterium]